MRRPSRGFVISMFSLFFIFSQFQNCAQTQVPIVTSNIDGEVRVIDRWYATKLNFVETAAVIQPSARETFFEGLCESNEGRIQWQLFESGDKSSVAAYGEVPCEGGGFRLTLGQIQSLVCDKDYILSGTDTAGNEDQLVIRRQCEPVASEAVPASSTAEMSCYKEVELTTGQLGLGESSCYLSCYRDGKLYSHDSLLDSECKNLVSYQGQ